MNGRTLTKRFSSMLLPACAFAIVLAAPVSADPVVLSGRVSCDEGPRVDTFEELVFNDSRTPCEARNALPRLLTAAKNESLRKVVWQRMLKQELRWVDGKKLKHIEEIAVACAMPIK